MLEAPRNWGANTGFTGFDEVPGGLAMGTLGAAWMREETPMLLHTFEFAVQQALGSSSPSPVVT
jgi:hypothetical protein